VGGGYRVEVIWGVTAIKEPSVVVPGQAGVVVTVFTMVWVLHPIWQLEQGPTKVVVPVVGQHASFGGMYVVFVVEVTQSGWAGQE